MSLDPRLLRNALGQFTTGVCVITANNQAGEPFGITVNSFASVSLDPALVLWSLRNDSECFSDFAATRQYAVNILTQEQLAQSNQYSQKDAHALSPEHFRIGKTGLPILRKALSSFECDIWQRYDGGDHVILVGKVIEMNHLPTGKPLVFQGGMYRKLR